jgi:hypothetical protein
VKIQHGNDHGTVQIKPKWAKSSYHLKMKVKIMHASKNLNALFIGLKCYINHLK